MWEYKIIEERELSEDDLNKLGKRGWELISNATFIDSAGSSSPENRWYFKRRFDPRNTGQAIGPIITNYLIKHGLTQREFSERAGLSQPLISRIINGDVVSVHARTLSRLVHALGVNVEDLEKMV